MKQAVVELSSGMDKHTVAVRATTRFITQARNPGLDGLEGRDTYTITMDFTATMKTIIEYLSRLTLLPLTAVPPSPQWEFSCSRDELGTIHRWTFVDFINDDVLMKQGHSWSTLGDMVMVQAPMTLHLVAIGRRDGVRRSSTWCKAFASTVIVGHYRFQRKGGKPLNGAWKPIWFADNPDNEPDVWVNIMEGDEMFLNGDLVQHINLREPDKEQARRLMDVMEGEIKRMAEALDDLESRPMYLHSCDSPYACPHQIVCYSPEPRKALKAHYERVR
jgi:hypothetical protein